MTLKIGNFLISDKENLFFLFLRRQNEERFHFMIYKGAEWMGIQKNDKININIKSHKGFSHLQPKKKKKCVGNKCCTEKGKTKSKSTKSLRRSSSVASQI